MMRFKVGDSVMAKWPGTQLYFKATVKKVDEDEDSADVLFEDGTEMDVPFDHIRSEALFRHPKKSKSPARRRSRSRSPARSPGRPATQTKSSPSRTKTKASPTRSSRRTRSSASASAGSSSSAEEQKPSSPSRMTITKSQRFDKTDKESKEGYEKVTTRSYQARITLEKVSDPGFERSPPAREETMCSKLDEAKQTIENAKKSMKKRHNYEYGGPFGVLFQYLFVPISIFAIVTAYGKKKSEFLKLSWKDISQDWRSYYDPTAIIIVVEFLLFHALIYALPVGNIIEGPKTYSGKKTEYRMNAFHCLFLTCLAFGGVQYMRLPIMIVYDKTMQIFAACVVLAFLFNFLLQFKSYLAPEDELNPKGNTGCTIYDVFVGRELHPKFGRYYHLKLLLYRPCMTAWILVNLIYIQKELTQNQTFRPSVGILAGFQILYCLLIFFWDETPSIFSFDIKNEGLGFLNLIGNLAIVPFIYTAPVRFLIDHPKAQLVPLPLLVTATVLLAIGLALAVLSSYQKTYFRVNPYDPNLSAIESIPPSKKGGSRLITSGYWGFVRHPNYLGEILLGVGYGLICGFSDVMPWLYVIFVTGLLIHRSYRVEENSREKHGYAWSEYCKRVQYRILPYVF